MKSTYSKIFKVITILLILIISIASLTSCNEEETEHFYVYGTFLEVTSKDSNGINGIYSYCEELEAILSPTVENSDLYKINHSNVNEPIKCNKVTMEIMKKAEEIYDKSQGAYDPSIYPLVRLWNFSSDRYMIYDDIPTSQEIEDTLKLVGLKTSFSIDYENGTITKLKDGAMLDFGGVAKGYVADTSKEKLNSEGLINLGGNIASKDKSYTIGIANPSRDDRKAFKTSYFCKLTLDENLCIATSGDYERYYEKDGTIYNHIINPFTGYPQDTSSSLISCSIISSDGAIGDAVATACIVLGKDKGIALINELNLKAVLIDSNFELTEVNISVSK